MPRCGLRGPGDGLPATPLRSAAARFRRQGAPRPADHVRVRPDPGGRWPSPRRARLSDAARADLHAGAQCCPVRPLGRDLCLRSYGPAPVGEPVRRRPEAIRPHPRRVPRPVCAESGAPGPRGRFDDRGQARAEKKRAAAHASRGRGHAGPVGGRRRRRLRRRP